MDYNILLRLNCLESKLATILCHLQTQGEILTLISEMLENGAMTPADVAKVVRRLTRTTNNLKEMAT